MPPIEIRPFRRPDRDQLTALVNAHVAAVVPGVTVSVNAVLSQLEREPDEAIVDPWVRERRTLVAIEHDAVVAGAHLLRYSDGDEVRDSYRGAGEIRWLVGGADVPDAIDTLIGACVAVFDAWGSTRRYADGSLPAPLVYGIPENWPHVRTALERAGFVGQGRVEQISFVRLDEIAAPTELPALRVSRSVGLVGTRLSALQGDEEVGMIEVEGFTGGRNPATIAWADIGNLEGTDEIKRWLVAIAADWLRLGGYERLAAYDEPDLAGLGFRHLTTTERGWRLP